MSEQAPSPSQSALHFNLPNDNESPLPVSNTPPRFPSQDEGVDPLETVRRRGRPRSSSAPSNEASPNRGNGGHIIMRSPSPDRLRPKMPDRKDRKEQSSRSISEALRVQRRREEQETLLEEGEQADDDGCYPPRKDSIPWQPNPHAKLGVYTTIHRIRRLVIASIGKTFTSNIVSTKAQAEPLQMILTVRNSSKVLE